MRGAWNRANCKTPSVNKLLPVCCYQTNVSIYRLGTERWVKCIAVHITMRSAPDMATTKNAGTTSFDVNVVLLSDNIRHS